MDLIRTGIGITKTIRNVTRLREIVLIFARHGFDEFITSGMTSKIPHFVLPRSKRGIKAELEEKSERDWGQIIGFRLRKCFEELGPAFIKFGQLLSSREDLFDQSFIDEMKILRDKVKPIPFEEVKSVLEKSLGKPIDSVFKEIQPHPIGTASIGVVYKATLLDGTEVVVKVRRPGIEKEMETDFSILKFLAGQAEKVSAEIRYLGVKRVVHDFAISLESELNFHMEALNCQRISANTKTHDSQGILYFPKFYSEYTREDLLVMEFLKGTPFSNAEKIEQFKKDLEPKLDESLKLFIKTFLKDGFFHADLHGGNFFYMENGQIGLIDFGLMGSLSKKGRKNFIAIIYALLSYNYENLVYEFLDVAEYDNIPDVDHLIADVRDVLSPYIGLTVQQTDFGNLLQEVVSTLKRHQLFLPREWFIVFRALLTLDGVGKSMGMDFDIYSLMADDIQEIVSESLLNKEELIEEAVWAGRDIVTSARTFPRHLKWYIREWAKKGYAFEIIHKGHEKYFKQITGSLNFLSFSILASVFISSGVSLLGSQAVTHWSQVPIISWIFWGMGMILLMRGLRLIRKKRW